MIASCLQNFGDFFAIFFFQFCQQYWTRRRIFFFLIFCFLVQFYEQSLWKRMSICVFVYYAPAPFFWFFSSSFPEFEHADQESESFFFNKHLTQDGSTFVIKMGLSWFYLKFVFCLHGNNYWFLYIIWQTYWIIQFFQKRDILNRFRKKKKMPKSNKSMNATFPLLNPNFWVIFSW